jgi:hypothetical protein
MNNTDKFIALYAANMKAESDKFPGRYMIPASWEALAAKMVASLKVGTANTSDAAKKTCKALGGKPTVSGVREFLNS